MSKEITNQEEIKLDTRIPNFAEPRTEQMELKSKKLSNHLNRLIQKSSLISCKNDIAPISLKTSKAVGDMAVTNGLFWVYRGQTLSSWYLCGEGSTDDMRSAYIQWCLKYHFNTVLLNLNNEALMSLFKPKKWMQVWDDARINVTLKFIEQLKAAGLSPAIVFYDGPADPSGKYYPILSCPDNLHADFIKIVCNALNPYVYIYLIGCETNRYWSIERVEAFIGYTKSLAGDGRFVGTHEQNVRFINGKWVLYRRVPNNAQFHCYETTNNPHDGNNVPVATMVQEVTFLCSQANRIPIWVGEHNTDILGTKSVAQARAMCNINGVLGMNGPM